MSRSISWPQSCKDLLNFVVKVMTFANNCCWGGIKKCVRSVILLTMPIITFKNRPCIMFVKARWVANVRHSKNWVLILKGLGSTDLEYYYFFSNKLWNWPKSFVAELWSIGELRNRINRLLAWCSICCLSFRKPYRCFNFFTLWPWCLRIHCV